MPSMAGFSRRMWSSSLATGRASLSAESTMNLRDCQRMEVALDFGRSKDLHDSIYAATVSFPHRSESGLATKVPAAKVSATLQRPGACRVRLDNQPFERDMSFLDALHVEAYSRY
jgi:hypothetical protein